VEIPTVFGRMAVALWCSELGEGASPTPSWRLNVKQALDAAAANGSNRIVLLCPRMPAIVALTCLNDLY
jgi:hypothetical protein